MPSILHRALRAAREALLKRRVHKIVEYFDQVVPRVILVPEQRLDIFTPRNPFLWRLTQRHRRSFELAPWQIDPNWDEVIAAGTLLGKVNVDAIEVERWARDFRAERINQLNRMVRRNSR